MYKNRRCILPNNIEKYLFHYSDEAKQLLFWLLESNPNKRPEAAEALKHKWFKDNKDGIEEALHLNKEMFDREHHEDIIMRQKEINARNHEHLKKISRNDLVVGNPKRISSKKLIYVNYSGRNKKNPQLGLSVNKEALMPLKLNDQNFSSTYFQIIENSRQIKRLKNSEMSNLKSIPSVDPGQQEQGDV